MHHGQCGRHVSVLQVQVVQAHLTRQQHAFIDNGACREGWDIQLLGMMQPQRADGMAGTLANDVELALEGIDVEGGQAATDENLADYRFDGFHALAQPAIIDRHVAPTEHFLPFGDNGALQFMLASHAGTGVAGQENHPDAIFAHFRQR